MRVGMPRVCTLVLFIIIVALHVLTFDMLNETDGIGGREMGQTYLIG